MLFANMGEKNKKKREREREKEVKPKKWKRERGIVAIDVLFQDLPAALLLQQRAWLLREAFSYC